VGELLISNLETITPDALIATIYSQFPTQQLVRGLQSMYL